MANILKLKENDIDEIVEFIKEKIKQCKNIDKLTITPKELIDKTLGNTIAPTLYIPAEVYTKMFALVQHSPVEISWHGLVERDIKNNAYTIYDILVFPQINSPTSTTTDEDEFADWITELLIDPTFPVEDLRLHGHSHVNMNVFSSGIDDQYQEDLISKVEDGDYYIFMILNKRHDICVYIYDYNQNILFDTDDILIQVIDDNNNDIDSWASQQIDELCKTTTPNPRYQRNITYGDLYGYSDDDFELSIPIRKSNKSKTNRRKK